MGIMTIDGQRVEFTDEPNVLSVIRKAGIDYSNIVLSLRIIDLRSLPSVYGGK